MVSSNRLRRGSRGCGIFIHQNLAATGKWLHRGEDVCVMCVLLAKSLPSGSFSFPPEWTYVLSCFNELRVSLSDPNI